MPTLSTVIWIVVALLLVGVYLSWTAGRLDRLHARIDAAKAALDAGLLRRASIAQELATAGVLDPVASMVLYQAAHDARLAEQDHREVAESELSQALRAVFAERAQLEAVRAAPGGQEIAHELGAAVRRVPMARRFHNDAVRAARALRRHRTVRWLRLAGHAPFPLAFEMDDEPPPVLADRGHGDGPGRGDGAGPGNGDDGGSGTDDDGAPADPGTPAGTHAPAEPEASAGRGAPEALTDTGGSAAFEALAEAGGSADSGSPATSEALTDTGGSADSGAAATSEALTGTADPGAPGGSTHTGVAADTGVPEESAPAEGNDGPPAGTGSGPGSDGRRADSGSGGQAGPED